MTPIQQCIKEKKISLKPIWLMRQAGRYLPEFRDVRKINTNFIKLCLNSNLSSEITLQPLKRFNLDAAIIFSDILIVPYALGQSVEFKKDFGPELNNLDLEIILQTKESDFFKKLLPVYQSIEKVNKSKLILQKDIIGFVGAPWTLLVYMINKCSPKKKLKENFFKDKKLIKETLLILEKFLKIHIKNQIKYGATIIQIFDSWAGLLEDKNLQDYVYTPTLNLVDFVKSLNVPVVCFPREIKNYKDYCKIIRPDVINIDYKINPEKIRKEIDIVVQGGLDPKILLTDKDKLKVEAKKYIEIFKDHPYIFNLGHGVLPETDPQMVDYLIKFVKSY
jgi:uroporphyrinogen decarboxylase